MAFQKGDPNIDKRGRVSPNKSTKLIKEAFAMLLEDNLEEMSGWLARIGNNDPNKAMEIMIKLSERFVPALSRTEVTGAEGEDIFKSISFSFGPDIDSDLRVREEASDDDVFDIE